MIKDQFGDPDLIATAQRKIHVLRQTGSVEEYTQEFNIIKGRTGFDETALIAIYKNGLNQTILELIYNRDTLPQNLTTWQTVAIRLGRHREEFRRGQCWAPAQSRWNQNQPRYNPPPNRPQQQQQQQQQRPQGPPPTNRPLPPGEPMEIDQRRGGQNCFYCGVFGHMARNCRQKQNGCFNCGQKGHAANRCTQPRRERVREVRIEEEVPRDRSARVEEVQENSQA